MAGALFNMKPELIHRIAETESTNDLAMELGRQGAAAGTVVVAETQSRGRGRLQRGWFSPAGLGLYFSVILRPVLAVVDLPKITLAAGVAACAAIEQQCQVNPSLKWPNDLLLGGRKFGGILCETGPVGGSESLDGPLVVLGMGVNINTPLEVFPEELRATATSLHLHGGRASDRELSGNGINRVGEYYPVSRRGEIAQVLARWRQRDALGGRRLRWLDPAGGIVTGEALGIDDSGQYHIRDAAGLVHEVVSGDISLVAST
jgi:BirA family biotin operon repressor/biotin-[acetyl-CoA-carboxylase] ligase